VLILWLTSCVVLVPADWKPDPDQASPAESDAPLDVKISELQQGLLPENTRVIVSGIAAHNQHANGVFLQDGSPDAWSGIWVDTRSMAVRSYVRGDELLVTGTYTELQELSAVEVVGDDDEVQNTGANHPLASPTILPGELFAEADNLEPYESMLVEVQDVEVVEVGTDSFVVAFATGEQLAVEDGLHGFPDSIGDTVFERLIGLLSHRNGTWYLLPRDDDDVLVQEAPPAVLTVDELQEGQLVVTEVMIDPLVCPDLNCEWIEVLNLTDNPVDLNGLGLEDSWGGRESVPGTVVVDSNDVALLALTDPGEWGLDAVTPDTWLGNGLRLRQQASTLWITSGDSAVDLDSITWLASETSEGVAWQLSADALSATSNDDHENWCPSRTNIPDSSDKGTPGMENHGC